MVQKRKSGLSGLIVVMLLLAGVLEGCSVGGDTYVLEEPFTERQVNNIHHGETTKKEILRWFGPPRQVTRPAGGAVEISKDDLYKHFEASPVRPQTPLVYYYTSRASSKATVGLGNAGIPLPSSVKTAELWILIDEKSGIVVDHRIEKAVNGKQKQVTTKKLLCSTCNGLSIE